MPTRKPRPLDEYLARRDFGKTPEPRGDEAGALRDSADPGRGHAPVFVIQKHAATRLHYDLRLELDGAMLSWAVPRGPSYDPTDRRVAIRTEDHPISYNSFEGTIPRGLYGAGTVILWDRGTWVPHNDPHQGLAEGKLVFALHGHKMAGLWELVRIAKPGEKQEPWLLFKKRDGLQRAKAEYDVISALPDSVSGKAWPAVPPSGARVEPPRGEGGMPAGAVQAANPPPSAVKPQLATLATGVPRDGTWRFEIKLDGYRLMTRIEGGKPKLITRGGHDWTKKMPALERAIAGLELDSAWLDGEIVVLGSSGVPEFNGLQQALDGRKSERIAYFLFDLLYLNGWDLRACAWSERRALLKGLLDGKQEGESGGPGRPGALRLSADFEADAATILESARRMQLEGVIAKRTDAPYVSARTETWLKFKCRQRQEFVICAYTDRGGERSSAEVGSLLLGVYADSGELVSVGGLGTGWDAATAAHLKARLSKLEIAKPACTLPPAGKNRWTRKSPGAERWVEPKLVVEASFADWTPDNQIRHATYEGLRADKPPREVRREVATTPAGALPLRVGTAGKGGATVTGSSGGAVVVSHPERVIDPESGLTKLALVRYYEGVAAWMLPHLKGRPTSLVRGPGGITGELFFQKHAEGIAEVLHLSPALWPGHEPLLEVPNARALASAAQMNTIELHTWNAVKTRIDKPDRMVFDLDPGGGVPWRHVQDAALLVRGLLQELGLQAWLKTSGGKGLHVVVPLAPKLGWSPVFDFSQAFVQHLARVIPARFVAKSGPANRVGKVFVDYLRNKEGATTVAAYSARARPGLGVSMPVEWEALDGIKSGAHWTVATARDHLSFQPKDPWDGYWSCRQTLTKAMKALGSNTT